MDRRSFHVAVTGFVGALFGRVAKAEVQEPNFVASSDVYRFDGGTGPAKVSLCEIRPRDRFCVVNNPDVPASAVFVAHLVSSMHKPWMPLPEWIAVIASRQECHPPRTWAFSDIDPVAAKQWNIEQRKFEGLFYGSQRELS